MQIKVRHNEKLRIEAGADTVFADAKVSNGQYVLEVVFHDMHNLQLRFKNGEFRMFVIPNEWNERDVDFGFFKDAEIVWEGYRK